MKRLPLVFLVAASGIVCTVGAGALSALTGVGLDLLRPVLGAAGLFAIYMLAHKWEGRFILPALLVSCVFGIATYATEVFIRH